LMLGSRRDPGGLERSIVGFCRHAPIRESLLGMVDAASGVSVGSYK
jgi:hypothetical protein